jgi:hypothetical protein
MVAVTYGGGRTAAPTAAAAKAKSKTGTKGKNIFARVIDAIAYTQMKRAEREIARHRHLLPKDYDANGGLRFASKETLPFGGW